MPKINQEEYEILKGMNKDWKFLARDEDGRLYKYLTLPFKQSEMWSAERQTWLKMNERNFQFIQWEDESPYNIAELIEEYENSPEYVTYISNERTRILSNDLWSKLESEETEVKNIEELKSWFEDDKLYVGEYVKHKINQLDEPEILSQAWISDNAVVGQYPDGMGYVVPAYRLQNLLVPKQEEKDPETVASAIADFYKSLERLTKVLNMEVEELEEC